MSSQKTSNIVDITQLKVACNDCNLFQLCLPLGLHNEDLARLDGIIERRRPVKKNTHMFRIGDPLGSLYALRSGSVKTYTLTDDGDEQVTGFYLPGELIGLEAIGNERHSTAAKALETSSVCEIPFQRLEDLCSQLPDLQHQMLKIMSKEIFQEQNMLMLLGKKSSEQRLAAFLISFSQRFKQRGFSATEFNLSMSRHDIGNYLGMAVETVSRLLTRFQEDGLLEVDRKYIHLSEIQRLYSLAGMSECPGKHFIAS